MSQYDVVHPEYQFYIERFVNGVITNINTDLHKIIKQDL